MNWRRRQPHELDHELLWLVISCVSLGGAILWFKLALPRPVCLFHSITHHPCLTCGATRCLIAFCNGSFTTSFYWNPLVFFALIGIILFDLYALIVLLFNLPRIDLCASKAITRKIRVFALLALATNWIYLWKTGI